MPIIVTKVGWAILKIPRLWDVKPQKAFTKKAYC